ncbi:MAG: NUDIX hydrolase [bacterium]|nr:NUDIX hydrolase [bacterium]
MATLEKSIARKNIRFAVIATDVVIFTILDNKLKTLLIPISSAHFKKNAYGFPGGMILPEETADDSVKRHMKAKAGIESPSYIEQLCAFSAIDRDPRGRVVSVAYFAIIPAKRAQSINRSALWAEVRKLPPLAYDHEKIAGVALERLENKLKYTTIGRHFLPAFFTLTELQHAHEIVLGQKLDKRNFRKKLLSLKFFKPTGKIKKGGRSRPAELYRFAQKSDTAIGAL